MIDRTLLSNVCAVIENVIEDEYKSLGDSPHETLAKSEIMFRAATIYSALGCDNV